jgi:hypothetical protein
LADELNKEPFVPVRLHLADGRTVDAIRIADRFGLYHAASFNTMAAAPESMESLGDPKSFAESANSVDCD